MATDLGMLQQAADMLPAMTARIVELVECESPSDSPAALAECARLLAPWLEEATGRPVEAPRVGDNVHLLVQAPAPRVLLLGHFDTVWPLGTTEQWPCSVVDGIASGPGIFDMKAGIVQMLGALRVLDDASGVSILLTSDEEVGSRTSRALIEQHAQAAGAVLVCEPSADGGAVKIGRKGIANYRIDVRGKAAHSGLEPFLGINAGVELAHQILAISELGTSETTVTPTVLSAGTTANTVPERAQCLVDVRAWTRVELERIHTTMSALASHLVGADVVVSGGVDRPPFEPEAAERLYLETIEAADSLGIARPAGVRSAGGSDGNITAALGIETLDGLGAVGAHPHGREEHVQIAAIPERTALLAALITRLAAGPAVR